MSLVSIVRSPVAVRISFLPSKYYRQHIRRNANYYPTCNIKLYAVVEHKNIQKELSRRLESYHFHDKLYHPDSYDEAVNICDQEGMIFADRNIEHPKWDMALL